MASHTRVLKPGDTQLRRMKFCLTLLGFVMAVGFVSAATIGIMAPAIWNTLFVPTLVTVPGILMGFIAWFASRWAWFRMKARHYGALLKLRTEAEYNRY